MNWRKISIVIGLLILFGGAMAFNFMTREKEDPAKDLVEAIPPQQIEVQKAKIGAFAPQIELEGRLSAYNKIDIFAEVGGRLLSTERPFKIGSRFGKGSVLMNIDREEAKLNLLSQKSSLVNSITQMMPDLKIDYPESFVNWSSYLSSFDINQPVRTFPTAVNEQETFFVNSRNLSTQYYNIKSLENRLSKYVVYAPFTGVITDAQITPGSLVRAGQKMGSLMELGNYELEATISLDELKYLKVGQKVALTSDGLSGSWTGRISRISDMIDANSQSVLAYISVKSSKLKEGLYLKGELKGNSIAGVTQVPADQVIEREYILGIEDGIFKRYDVEVVYRDSESMLVKGLPDGTLLPVEKVLGASEGKSVIINSESF